MTLAIALCLAIIGGVATAQAQQPRQPLGSSGASAEKPPMEKAMTIEGSVKKVDPATKSVQISSGLLNLAGRTLEVTEETQIQFDGRPGSLADLREGSKVKASYESRDGKNLATRIEAMPAPEPTSRTSGGPGSPAAPSSVPGSPGSSDVGTKTK
jgi:Cu/Ag efflux protein CusF